MKIVQHVFGLFFVLLITLYSFAQEQTGTNTPAGAGRRLREFLDNDWKYWVTEYPEFATAVGYPGNNNRWTDLSQPAIEARNRHLQESLKILLSLPRTQLPASDLLNYELYEKLIETAIAGLRFHNDAFPLASVVPRNFYMPMNQIEGVIQDVPYTIEIMPSARASDYQDIIARLDSVPRLVDQTIELMKAGLSHGWSPPKITMRDVPNQIESQIVADPESSPLLGAFKHYPGTFTTEQQRDFTRQAVAAYTERVAPALQKLRDFLVTTYIPGCRDSIAVQDLTNGSELYEYLIRWHTTTNLRPEQIHQIGLEQVRQLHSEMRQVMAQTEFTGTLEEFIKFINTDPRFRFANGEDLLLHYRDIAKRIDPELSRLFGKLPRLPYGVKPVPEATAPSQTAGYYGPGAPPAGRPGYFYVNTYKPESRPWWTAEDLTLHEAVPGHHLQISIAQEMERVPEFRKQLGYTAYVEGWGLYAETLGNEIGLYTDPYSKFGYLSAQMWRAVRLVVDTGIHFMGWSRDRALQYFVENSGQPEQNVVVEVDRYIVWPGQALGYKIGQSKIQELRTAAERDLGDRFNLRAFHDAILDEGAVPLDVLESRIRKFVAAQKKTK